MPFEYDVSNLSLGAGKFWVDKGGGYTPVGLTQDSQDIGYEPTFQDIMANETGEALLNKILKGEKMTVKLNMLERTAENFKTLFPFATEYSGTGKSYGIGHTPYASLITKAFKLKFHPINQRGTGGVDDETYLDDDWTFWLCANASPVTESYTKDGLRTFQVTLDVFADDTKAEGMRLALKGDPANTTLDVTPPTVSTVKVEKTNVLTTVEAGTELTDVDADTNIEIVVSESLESGGAINHKNYGLYNQTTDVGVDLSGAAISYNDSTKKVTINPADNLSAGVHYVLSIQGLKDTSGNQMVPVARRFQVSA